MQTRICRLHGKNDLRIESQPVPTPGRDEVQIQVGAGGICGSDLHYWRDGGIGTIRVREPIILGHEVAGTVIACGPGVDTVGVGDRVALNPSHPCGTCVHCKAGNYQHCLEMRFKGSAIRLPHEQGMFRDRLVIGASQCHPIAEGISLHEAALAEPLSVCLRAIGRASQIAGPINGKRVLVTGAGPIGVLCAALARHFGADEVVVTDIEDNVLGVAGQVGATRTINVSTQSAGLDPWMKDKGQFDLAFECSAASAAIRAAIQTVRPLGTIVQVGVTGDVPMPLNQLVAKEINLVGTHRFHREFAEAVALINSGDLPLAKVVTHRFPLENVQEAFQIALDRSKAVKVQLTFAAD